MSKLKYFYSSMRAGKSTLALQMYDNFKRINEPTLLISTIDDKVESRIGLSEKALSLTDDLITELPTKIEYDDIANIIIDESQFVSIEQADKLSYLVDDLDINIYCFGLLTDYRGKLFTGSKRLIELADEVEEIQAKSLCWCGRKATHNMRIDELGYPYIEGDIVGIGEGYEVLCREHFNKKITRQVERDIMEE